MKEGGGSSRSQSPVEQKPAPSAAREADAIYQRNQIVGRVRDVEVDREAKEIRFGEISNTDFLLLPDECEYQKYRILIQRVAYATKVHPTSAEKGRILKGAIADILGFREQ